MFTALVNIKILFFLIAQFIRYHNLWALKKHVTFINIIKCEQNMNYICILGVGRGECKTSLKIFLRLWLRFGLNGGSYVKIVSIWVKEVCESSSVLFKRAFYIYIYDSVSSFDMICIMKFLFFLAVCNVHALSIWGKKFKFYYWPVFSSFLSFSIWERILREWKNWRATDALNIKAKVRLSSPRQKSDGSSRSDRRKVE